LHIIRQTDMALSERVR